MNRSLVLTIAGAFALSACSGAPGSVTSTGQAFAPQSASVDGVISPDHKKRKLTRITFHFKLPRTHRHPSGNRRSPNWIPPSTAQVSITLNTVNGGPPPAGLVTTKTTNLTNAGCGAGSGCTVTGPASPPGSDNFTVRILDNKSATLAKATQTFTLTVGHANSGNLTLLGVPATFTIGSLPAATAGTGFTASGMTLVALDHAGDTIVGTYANPITLGTSDATGATAFTLESAGPTPAPTASVQVTSSTAHIDFIYSGLAIAPATLTAHAQDATDKTSTFTPALTAPNSVCNGDGLGTTECATPGPQINLYAISGTGSTTTFTASQTGWSGSFAKTFGEGDTCSGVATITTGDSLTFTATAANTASATTCDVTLTGGGGETLDVPVTFTSSSVGIFGRHRRRP